MSISTQLLTAIDFLTTEKKTIDIDVSNHLDTSNMFRYNRSHTGSDHISIPELTKDWNDFYFELKLEIDFDFVSVHERQTHDYPGFESLSFENVRSEIQILQCSRWDDQDEELKEYRLSNDEKKAVLKYLEANTILTE